jgi:hypothetical protein
MLRCSALLPRRRTGTLFPTWRVFHASAPSQDALDMKDTFARRHCTYVVGVVFPMTSLRGYSHDINRYSIHFSFVQLMQWDRALKIRNPCYSPLVSLPWSN